LGPCLSAHSVSAGSLVSLTDLTMARAGVPDELIPTLIENKQGLEERQRPRPAQSPVLMRRLIVPHRNSNAPLLLIPFVDLVSLDNLNQSTAVRRPLQGGLESLLVASLCAMSSSLRLRDVQASGESARLFVHPVRRYGNYQRAGVSLRC